MDNNKFKAALVIAIVALAVSIGGIVYATLTTTLTINGGANFNPANWDIKFTGPVTTGNAERGRVVTTPSITATTLGTYEGVLTAPGDAFSLTFNVANGGDLDSILAALSRPEPVCTGSGATADVDAAMVCDNLVYTLTYSGGTYDGTNVATGDTLNVGDTKAMIITVEYPATMTTIPTAAVKIKFPAVTLVYEQN
jgi:hypothetical protein